MKRGLVVWGLALVVAATAQVAAPAQAMPLRSLPNPGGWARDLVCDSRFSASRNIGVQNLSSVPIKLKVRGIDCFDWSNTGNPAQITGSVLSPSQASYTE